MNAPESPQKSIMLGDFVHSRTKNKLEFMYNSGIAVNNENGKIVDIENSSTSMDIAKQKLLQRLHWSEDEVEIYKCEPGQFFFPGFIGTLITSIT